MESEKKSNGALVGLAVIVIILVIGGVYMWQSNKNTVSETPVQSETFTSQDSASLNALEQDVNTANTSTGVDANAVN